MERNSCIFYKSFYDSIKELDSTDQVQIYNAIFKYQFEGELIELSSVCKSIFTLIIPQLEANNKRYNNGCKGGRPKTKEKPKKNQNETKLQPNENDNDNVNDNNNVNNKEKDNNKLLSKKKEMFCIPTLEEVKEYCLERNNNVDPESFIDFYESKGWVVGKTKMKDWKAAVRTWERNRNNQPKKETEEEWFERMEREVKEREENEHKRNQRIV